MLVLIFGATGTLGQALLRAAKARGLGFVGAARRGADRAIDVTDAAAIDTLIHTERPDIVVNCAAITDLDACEREPAAAYLVNARAAALMAAASAAAGARFVHISTDHFFDGPGAALHDEGAAIRLVNEYARSKHAGETLALAVPGTLALRTNLAGWRGWPARPSFIEWAASALRQDGAVTGFSDFFTSTIDADALAAAIFDLLARGATGLLNVGACEAVDKATFLRAFARALGVPAERVRDGSVRSLATPRATGLGLDVRRAEVILGYRLPDHEAVIAALLRSRPAAPCAS